MEQWKWIGGFEGTYKIYRDGRVYSVRRKAFRKTELMKVGGGYFQVGLWNKCKRKQKCIHRLVAEAFIPNPNEYTEVDHINRDSRDNRIENLRWCSRSTNLRNKIETMRKNNKTGLMGVSFRHERRKPWGAVIVHNYKHIRIGSFSTKEEAALAYNKKARELRGELAYQNIIP